MSGRRWTPRLQDERLAQAIAERNELPEILAASWRRAAWGWTRPKPSLINDPQSHAATCRPEGYGEGRRASGGSDHRANPHRHYQ